MKIFIKNLVLFFSSFILLLLLLLVSFNYTCSYQLATYRLAPNVSAVYCGDSHIQLGIDDRLLPNSVNLANKAESVYFTYYKLLSVLKNNPSVKKVYLGFGYHSMSSYYDDFVYGKYAVDIASKYFFMLPLKDKKEMMKKMERDALPSFIRNVFTDELESIYNHSFLGKFQNKYVSCSAVEKSMDKRIAVQFYDSGKIREFSSMDSEYLCKTKALCNQYNVELILINTPLSPYYKSKIPATFINKYYELVKTNKLKLIDISDLPLADSSYIPDGDHVSARGAVIATEQVGKLINGM